MISLFGTGFPLTRREREERARFDQQQERQIEDEEELLNKSTRMFSNVRNSFAFSDMLATLESLSKADNSQGRTLNDLSYSDRTELLGEFRRFPKIRAKLRTLRRQHSPHYLVVADASKYVNSWSAHAAFITKSFGRTSRASDENDLVVDMKGINDEKEQIYIETVVAAILPLRETLASIVFKNLNGSRAEHNLIASSMILISQAENVNIRAVTDVFPSSFVHPLLDQRDEGSENHPEFKAAEKTMQTIGYALLNSHSVEDISQTVTDHNMKTVFSFLPFEYLKSLRLTFTRRSTDRIVEPSEVKWVGNAIKKASSLEVAELHIQQLDQLHIGIITALCSLDSLKDLTIMETEEWPTRRHEFYVVILLKQLAAYLSTAAHSDELERVDDDESEEHYIHTGKKNILIILTSESFKAASSGAAVESYKQIQEYANLSIKMTF